MRVPLPKPSKETREQSVKQLSQLVEACKQRMRRTRQQTKDRAKKAVGMSEDDFYRAVKDLDKIFHDKMEEIQSAANRKKDEILG